MLAKMIKFTSNAGIRYGAANRDLVDEIVGSNGARGFPTFSRDKTLICNIIMTHECGYDCANNNDIVDY